MGLAKKMFLQEIDKIDANKPEKCGSCGSDHLELQYVGSEHRGRNDDGNWICDWCVRVGA